jgi:magnesium-transporting ATPase (P-type)
LLHCAILSSSAKFEGDGNNKELNGEDTKIVGGGASEAALLRLVEPIERVSSIRSSLYSPAVDKQGNQVFFHFSSETKYAFGVYCPITDDHLPQKNHIFIKGAPENVWKRCRSIKVNGKNEPIANF